MAIGSRERLQQEIAVLAARHMVESGDDCAAARRKAAAELGADASRMREGMPDRRQIETALRAYLRTVIGAPYRAWLREQRQLAARWMEILAEFEPYLVGAVLNGSATRDCHVHLQLFADSAKDVEMALLDRGLDIRVEAADPAEPHAQERIGFVVGGRGSAAGVLLTVYDRVALRVAPPGRNRPPDPDQHPLERAGRANLAMLRELLAVTAEPAATAHAAE